MVALRVAGLPTEIGYKSRAGAGFGPLEPSVMQLLVVAIIGRDGVLNVLLFLR